MKIITSYILRVLEKYYFLIPSLLFCFLYYQSIYFGQAWGDDSFVITPQTKDFQLVIKSFYSVTGMVSDHYMPVHCLQCFLINFFFGKNAFPFGFHLYQYFAQCIVCVLATILFCRITSSKLISVLIVSLWTIHPVNQQQLTRLVVGPGIMGFGFILSYFLLYLKVADRNITYKSYLLMLVGNIFFLLGIMSVEYFLFFPILLFFILCFLKREELITKRNLSLLFSIISIYPVYFLVRYLATNGGLIESANLVTRWMEIGSMKDILFRAVWFSPQLLVHYLKLFFCPYGLVDSAAEWYMVGDSLLSPYSIFCQCIVIALIIFAIVFFRTIPLFSIGIIWFLISMLLVIQIIPLFSIVALRYLYIPSLGLTLALFGLLTKSIVKRKLVLLICLSLFCFLISRTLYYMPSSKDFLNQFVYCVKEAPVWNKPLWVKLAIEQARKQNELDRLSGFLSKGSIIEDWLDKFLDLKPSLAISYGPMQMQYNYLVYRLIFNFLVETKRFDDLSKAFDSALVVKGNYIGWNEIASFLVRVNKWDMAWEATKQAIINNPKFQLSYNTTFIEIVLRTKKYNEAIPLVENYIKLNPKSSFPYLFAGLFYSKIGNNDKALSYLEKSISYDKALFVTGEELYYQAARIFVENKMYEEAKQTLRIMLRLNPFSDKAKARLYEIDSLLSSKV